MRRTLTLLALVDDLLAERCDVAMFMVGITPFLPPDL